MAKSIIDRIKDLENKVYSGNIQDPEIRNLLNSISVDLSLLPKPIDNKDSLESINKSLLALLAKPSETLTPSLDKIVGLLADGKAVKNFSPIGGGYVAWRDTQTFPEKTSSFTPVGGVYDDTFGAASSGAGVTQRFTSYRAGHVNLRNSSGTEIGTNSTPIAVVGNVASGTLDSGNPVKVGGVYNLQSITLSTGQRGDLQLESDGKLKTVAYTDDSQLDAFHRLRVSNPNTVFDNQNQYNASTLYYENVLTGLTATVTHVPNESAVNLTLGVTNGDKVVRQTREYFRYQPGKSQLILMTAVVGTTTAGLRKRWGYYDANDGLFFEDDGTGLFVVQRSSVTGSPQDNRVAQANFNIDKLDGTGPSGVNLDLKKANIYWIDLQWLGVGCVTFGVYTHNGVPIKCHQFHNPNVLTTPYMKTANLPVRKSIENTATSAGGTFKSICHSVITEDGGAPVQGLYTSVANGTTTIAVTTRRAVLSIRPKATFNGITNRGQLKDFEFQIAAGTSDAYFELVYNPTFTGTPVWTSAGANSITEYSVHADAAAGAFTGGIVVDSGYALSSQGSFRGTISEGTLSKLPLSLDIAGANPIAFSIVCSSMTGTSNDVASLKWKEIY